MKLNDFKQIEKQLNESKLNELDMSDFIGQRAAAGTKVWADKLNPFSKGSGKISVKDKMASEMFVKDFIGRASEDLARAIKGGLVDPESGSGAAPADPYAKGDQKSPYEPEKKEPTMGKDTVAPAAAKTEPKMGATPTPTKPLSLAAPAAKPSQPVWHTSQQLGYNPTKKQPADVTDVEPKAPKQIGMNKFPRLKEGTKFDKLDYVFESILEADAAYSQTQPAQQGSQYPDTISSYLQKMFKQYTKGITVDPATINQVKAIADQAQQNYNSMNPLKRGARQELAKLGNMAYALSYRDSEGYKHGKYSAAADQATTGATAGASAPAGELTGLDALRGRSTAGATTAAGTTTPSAASVSASPEQVKSVYAQVKGLMKQLNKQQKGYILNALQKELGAGPSAAPAATPAAPAAEPAAEPTSNAGAGAFARMGQQLTQPGSGTVHKKSRTNPNIKRRPRTAAATTPAAAPATTPVDNKAAKIKKARATRKPTIKEFKVWGKK